MNCTRRSFLKGGIASLFLGSLNFPLFASNSQKKNLVVIMLRGGMDGMTAVPLTSDTSYEKLRKGIVLSNNLKLDSDFALHPKLSFVHELWKKNMAGIVHATNIPYIGRSHFDGQNLMESGGKIPYSEKSGWLGRGLELSNLHSNLTLSLPSPLILRGSKQVDNFYPGIIGKIPKPEYIMHLRDRFEKNGDNKIVDILNLVIQRPPEMLVTNDLVDLSTVAGKLLKDPAGPRVAVFDLEGFDTHGQQGDLEGQHADHLSEIDQIIEILYDQLQEDFDNTLVVTVTEFGRTIEQNGAAGTEHGYGSAIIMAGGILKKSQVFSDWPGLKSKDLFEGRDLMSTIDSRSIYASAMSSVFDIEFEQIKRNVFWNDPLVNFSEKLFKYS
jgi:uncharacterized protein (DUF1501 family)